MMAGLPIVCALWLLALPAYAQKYPDRPVRIIVPSAPGGGYDVVGRALARKLGEQMGGSFVVENRVGAGTVVGTQAAATASADGYTLLVGGPSNLVFNAALFRKLPYQPGDFTTLSLVVNFPYTLAVRKDMPQSSLKDLVEAARRSPGKLSVATAGAGSGQHLLAAAFMKTTGTDLLVVHYKGAQQAYPDLLSGRVDMLFDTVASVRAQVEAGKLKLVTLNSAQRSPMYPHLPTAREDGFPGIELDAWIGLFAPVKTPPAIVDRLRTETERAVRAADFRSQMESTGGQMMSLSPRESEAFVRAELERWIPLIREAGITAE
jgi:tripartite-type tricarboxylate transporter receptor subunit TctC